MKYEVSLSKKEFEMLEKFIDELYEQLHRMSEEELKQWYIDNAALPRLLGIIIFLDNKYIESSR